MKKSEMIQRLGWYLGQISNLEIGSKEDAEDVLDFLENWGMYPPHNQKAQEMSGSMAPSIGCCQWEPENET